MQGRKSEAQKEERQRSENSAARSIGTRCAGRPDGAATKRIIACKSAIDEHVKVVVPSKFMGDGIGHISATEERLRELNRLYDEAELACAAELRRYDDENEQKKRRRLERFRVEMAPTRREAAGLLKALGRVDAARAAMLVLPEEPCAAGIPSLS